jgi:hypothetical protein
MEDQNAELAAESLEQHTTTTKLEKIRGLQQGAFR